MESKITSLVMCAVYINLFELYSGGTVADFGIGIYIGNRLVSHVINILFWLCLCQFINESAKITDIIELQWHGTVFRYMEGHISFCTVKNKCFPVNTLIFAVKIRWTKNVCTRISSQKLLFSFNFIQSVISPYSVLTNRI